MRTWIAVMLMAVLLTGCGAKPAEEPVLELPPVPPATEPAPQELMPELPEPQVLRFETETLSHRDEAETEDGTLLAAYTVLVPQLTVWREDGTEVMEAQTPAEEQALDTAEKFNEKFREWTDSQEFSGAASAAKEHYAWCQEEQIDWLSPYRLDLNCSVHQTERMVSVSGIYYSNTGGAHPNASHLAWNYDLETGMFFDPKLLGSDTGFQEAVAQEIIRQAGQAEKDGWTAAEMYWEDYETIVADWSSYAVFFDDTGMTVTFSPYELAPYAAGPQEFYISYERLEAYLSEHGKTLLGLDTAE